MINVSFARKKMDHKQKETIDEELLRCGSLMVYPVLLSRTEIMKHKGRKKIIQVRLAKIW